MATHCALPEHGQPHLARLWPGAASTRGLQALEGLALRGEGAGYRGLYRYLLCWGEFVPPTPHKRPFLPLRAVGHSGMI
jgi:hypothetical protein